MKVVHLSDLHIGPGIVMGSNPVEHLRCVLTHVTKFHDDACRYVITGDLVDQGDEQSYRLLRALLEEFGLTGERAPRLLIGNHDARPQFLSVFPETPCDQNGFVQSVDETPLGWFVYLDTHQPGTDAGHYCTQRFEWLQGVLDRATAEKQPVWLFMHHNPVPVHVTSSDSIGLVQTAQFKQLIARYASTLRHIFFGHCHFTLSGTVQGVPLAAPRSIHESLWPYLEGEQARFATGPLERNYNVCFIEPDTTIIHTVDYEKYDRIRLL
ncbi:metallophosphoesterase [Granulosicoccus antarcticus]|uniref:3',5'-cyclic adenosine monophosphate phosphodiesterase CpdA n=1 Tax=Granulosicoccus antarcticus IMCC3135 TaxID=1192854 RepID=A0A2Z2NQZ5_9GAMM|nr:metallophosphoesterase [Granulosicoccus antarcticus]ASJ73763.1 3',5'-cyclic adenosine monophosphate phosphodiesterase CpdA [Granulosicoccus antarcticus IMCC3135]